MSENKTSNLLIALQLSCAESEELRRISIIPHPQTPSHTLTHTLTFSLSNCMLPSALEPLISLPFRSINKKKKKT